MLHLHNNYSFTESLVETVVRSLHHSCRSELRDTPQFPAAQTIPSPDCTELRISAPEYFRLPDGFMPIARPTIWAKPVDSRCCPSKISRQMRSNRSTSACLEDKSGK